MNPDPTLLNVLDYEAKAAETMDRPWHAYYAGGVCDDRTLRDNRDAFARLRLRPRMLRDVSRISTEVTIAGSSHPLPFLIAPTAMHKLAHPDGELATARAARAHGVTHVLSSISTTAVEDVVGIGHDVWFQLYVLKDRAWSERIVRRVETAGAQALVWTVDLPVSGLRENLVRAEFSTPPELPFPNLTEPGAPPVHDLLATLGVHFDPGLTWKDLDWLRSITDLPIWVKGLLRDDDARRAVDAGATGVIVSNHGGRQLDTAVAALDALPEIVAAVGDRTTVLMDGGVRRGTDVLKALALGARAVLLGRAVLWGLAVDGEAGATHVLQILRDELTNVMAQCGCPDIASIGPDLIFRGR